MKSEFNALDTVVIKDNFYDDPDKIRNQAISKSYQQPPGHTPRLAVTAVCNEDESQAMIDLLKPYLPSDNENNIDLCLKQSGIPILVQVNKNIAIDPNDDKNPKTQIEVVSRW